MAFVWKTSSIGYPNFFQEGTASAELSETFKKLAAAAAAGTKYNAAKEQFQVTPHQVETKKAAFQEFGLLYVVPRSDLISVTPVGEQVLAQTPNRQEANSNRSKVLFLLGRALARYQFNNPLPIGRDKEWAEHSDVRPYLAIFYLMVKLDGLLTVSELYGCIFGISRMGQLPRIAEEIAARRKAGKPFDNLLGLPEKTGTLENLKIYFMAHAGLDSEILCDEKAMHYATEEQCYELTEEGFEICESILTAEWPEWRQNKNSPTAQPPHSFERYFTQIIGLRYDHDVETQLVRELPPVSPILLPDDIESLRRLPKREFKEGTKKLVTHLRVERDPLLVRTAKRTFKHDHGHLYCEACNFHFKRTYGKRGEDFIEAHHKKPISTLTQANVVAIDDLAMVCANCHRMLHRRPWITVEELQELLKQITATV